MRFEKATKKAHQPNELSNESKPNREKTSTIYIHLPGHSVFRFTFMSPAEAVLFSR